MKDFKEFMKRVMAGSATIIGEVDMSKGKFEIRVDGDESSLLALLTVISKQIIKESHVSMDEFCKHLKLDDEELEKISNSCIKDLFK